eukprot:COSAG02_NODE_28794_length_582_cov_0.993789_1_plen_98_part_00
MSCAICGSSQNWVAGLGVTGWVRAHADPTTDTHASGSNARRGPTNVMLSLIGYAEAERMSNPQISDNVTKVVLNHFLAMKKNDGSDATGLLGGRALD